MLYRWFSFFKIIMINISFIRTAVVHNVIGTIINGVYCTIYYQYAVGLWSTYTNRAMFFIFLNVQFPSSFRLRDSLPLYTACTRVQ